jgi:hypothetical protein
MASDLATTLAVTANGMSACLAATVGGTPPAEANTENDAVNATAKTMLEILLVMMTSLDYILKDH